MVLRAHTIQLATYNDWKFSVEMQPLNPLSLHTFPGQETKKLSRYTFFKRLYCPLLLQRGLAVPRSHSRVHSKLSDQENTLLLAVLPYLLCLQAPAVQNHSFPRSTQLQRVTRQHCELLRQQFERVRCPSVFPPAAVW